MNTSAAATYVTQQEYGGPEVLHLAERPVPEPGPGEVRIRAAASSLNPIDAKTRAGRGAASAIGRLPMSVGWDVAGLVEAVGPGVDPALAGRAVLGMPRFPQEAGTYATHLLAPADEVVPVPDGTDWLTAAALPLAGLTALSALTVEGEVAPGQRVLVRGGTGGVGHLAVQIARTLGAEVIATAGADRAAFARRLGAHQVVERGTPIASVVPERSLDVVVDLVGGDELPESVALTRPGGIVVCVPGGTDAGLDDLAARYDIRPRRTSVRPDRDGLLRLTGWLAEGRLAVHVDRAFGLDEIVDAHRALEAGGHRGKLGVRVDTDLATG